MPVPPQRWGVVTGAGVVVHVGFSREDGPGMGFVEKDSQEETPFLSSTSPLISFQIPLCDLNCGFEMTTYGTIPTSSSSFAPSNLAYISAARHRIKAGLGTRRPWSLLFHLRSFVFPSSFAHALSRTKANVAFFRMNYAIIILFILFLSLLWHPISLIVFIVMMAVWLFLYFLRDEPLLIFGRTIDDRVVLGALLVLTILFLLLTHATLNILVALLIGVAVVVVHGAMRKTDDLVADEEATGLLPPGSSSSS